MHMKNERYFIIAGFITCELHKVTSVHKKAEAVIKLRKNIPLKKVVELKSSRINPSQQAFFLNELFKINSVIPIAVVIDKERLSGFKASENLAYNYFVKCLIKYLIKCKIVTNESYELILRLDNRNVSVKKLRDLETFLNWEFISNNFSVNVIYLDSKFCRDVQMADYVANYLWKKFNNRASKLLSMVNIRKKIFISRFPYNYLKK